MAIFPVRKYTSYQRCGSTWLAGFDAVLPKSAYGSRLRHYRPEPGAPKGSVGDYHLKRWAPFQPYFGPYKEWRSRGLKALRTELELATRWLPFRWT